MQQLRGGFMTICNLCVLLRVIDLSTPTMQHEHFTLLPLQASSPSSANDSSSMSGELVDTDILPSNDYTSSRSSLPAVFHILKFSYDAELKHQQLGLVHPSIHPFLSAYPGPGGGGSCLSRDTQTSLSPDTSSSSSGRIPRCSQASWAT